MKKNISGMVLIALAVAMLAGCGRGRDFDAPQAGEIPKGPGVFTKGDDGAVLYDSKGGGLIPPQTRAPSQQPVKSKGSEPSSADFEAYEAYQEWKTWKQDPQNAEAYKEFNEWLEWKQYQQWKRNQPSQQ